MSTNPLNDISRVYLEQVSESAVPGKPAERLGAVTAIPKSEQDAARERTLAKAKAMREKKGIKEAAKPDYLDFDKDGNEKESMKKALRDKAKQKMEEAKKTNDGNLANNYPPYDKVTRGDVIAGRLGKDEMGGSKKVAKEGFSNWREDLVEITDKVDNKENQKIVEKQVKNKIKTSAIGSGIKIGESVENLGGTLIEMVELDEEVLTETVDIATEYFYEQGLNEEGLDILIEELGLEEFVNFVFEISEEYTLNEARTLLGKKKSPQKLPKGTAPSQATKAAVQKYGTTRRFKSSPASSTVRKKSVAIKKAVEKQPSKKPVRDAIAKGIFGAVKAYQSGMERHRAATQTAGKALRVAAKGASEFGKGVKSGVTGTVTAAKKIKKAVSEEVINEKAASEQQQKIFGLALSVKRGQTPRSEVSDAVLKIVDDMSEKKIRDFAKTKHERIPKKVEEAVADSTALTPQELQVQKQRASLDTRIATLRKQALMKQRKPETVSEEDSDRMKDRQLERGGMGARSSTSPAKQSASKPETPAEREARMKRHKETSQRALDFVRQQMISKHGKGSLM
jgi:hypothetical protein